MKSRIFDLIRLFLFSFLLILAACGKKEPLEKPKELRPSSRESSESSAVQLPLIELVLVESQLAPEETKSPFSPIVYEEGDTFQGMWNYNRRSANLKLTIESVDHEIRTVAATMQSYDLDDGKKEFAGTIGEDGRQMVLTGIAGTGSHYETVSGYNVRDFLRKSSSMKVILDDCNARKLRGEVENGTNIYFWSAVKEN